jgi:hypothetical protein
MLLASVKALDWKHNAVDSRAFALRSIRLTLVRAAGLPKARAS